MIVLARGFHTRLVNGGNLMCVRLVEEAVLKIIGPKKGFGGFDSLTHRLWYRGVMVTQRLAKSSYGNVVRVRVTAIPLAATQMSATSAAG